MDDETELGKKEGYAKNSAVWSRRILNRLPLSQLLLFLKCVGVLRLAFER